MKERIVPQQYAGQRPPKGWVPPLGQDLTLLGVYDNESGYWMGLPLQVLREALLTAESLHTEDRIDERDKIEVTVPDVSAQDVVKTKEYEVPAGELWYLNRFNLVTEAEVSGNIRVSKFPKVRRPLIRNTLALTRRLVRLPTMTWLPPDSLGQISG